MAVFGGNSDFIEKYQSLDDLLITNKENTRLFKMNDDCMNPRIFSGDLLVVDSSATKHNQKICIVVVEGEILVRKVKFQNNRILLCDMADRKTDITQLNYSVIGVVVSFVRQL